MRTLAITGCQAMAELSIMDDNVSPCIQSGIGTSAKSLSLTTKNVSVCTFISGMLSSYKSAYVFGPYRGEGKWS